MIENIEVWDAYHKKYMPVIWDDHGRYFSWEDGSAPRKVSIVDIKMNGDKIKAWAKTITYWPEGVNYRDIAINYFKELYATREIFPGK